MKSKIFQIIALAGAAAVGGITTSCSDNWQGPDDNTSDVETGRVTLSAPEIVNIENIVSRAGVDTSSFIVTILDAEGNEMGQWTYAQLPGLIELPVATGYTVNVISHVQEKAAWDKPYFEGTSTAFAVTKDAVTEVDPVTCRLANIKVSVRFDDDLLAKMSDDCAVNVVCNDEGSLSFGRSESRSGYFQALPGSSTLVATLTGKVDGAPVSITRAFSDVEAGQHRIITYSVKTGPTDIPDETGTIDPSSGISIDLSTIDETVEGGLTVGEENLDDNDRPGQETPETPVDPDPSDPDPSDPGEEVATFESSTISMTDVNPVVDGIEYKVNITTANPIQNFNVTIDSPTLTEDVLVTVGLAKQFDLCEPGSLEEGLRGLEFPVGDEVRGHTDVVFDITRFIPLLDIYGAAEHHFILNIVDNKGNSVTQVLKFQSND